MGELTRFRTLRNPGWDCGDVLSAIRIPADSPKLADLRALRDGREPGTVEFARQLGELTARWEENGGIGVPSADILVPLQVIDAIGTWLRCHPEQGMDDLLRLLEDLLRELDRDVEQDRIFLSVLRSGDWAALETWLEESLVVRLAEASYAALASSSRVVELAAADDIGQILARLRLLRAIERFSGGKDPRDRVELDQAFRDPMALPTPPFPLVPGPAMAGPPVVADLYVVRDEWASYRPGEIAFIENVLPGEDRERSTVTVNRTETVAELETSSLDRSRTETYESERTTESEETSKQTSLEIGLQFNNDLTLRYGPVENNTKIGASLAFSRADAEKRAREVARESGRRAVEETERTVRQLRRETTETRVRELDRHQVRNSSSTGVRGVYRWVERLQRYQLFRYPHRLQLEFYLPEPGKFLRQLLMERPAASAQVSIPPALHLTQDGTKTGAPITVEGITANNYQSLGALLGVVDLPTPPQSSLVVTESLALNGGTREKEKNSWDLLPFPPVSSGTKDVQLPEGYQAESWGASAAAAPELAKWRDFTDWQDAGDGVDERIGYHSVVASVTLGAQNVLVRNRVMITVPPPLPPVEELNTVHVGHADYRSRWLAENAVWVDAKGARQTRTDFADPLVGKLSFGATLGGAHVGTVSITLYCAPTEQAMQQWRTQVYSALRTAVDARTEEIANAELATRDDAADEVRRAVSPSVRGQLIRNEIKRQVLDCLLRQQFSGFDDAPTGPDANQVERPAQAFGQSLAHAVLVRFFEQSFEWDNLMHVLYPTYWSSSKNWQHVVDFTSTDLSLTTFLEAGGARVLVPARPGLEAGVYTFMELGLVIPGDIALGGDGRTSLSVAQEVIALTRPAADGVPGESWESPVATALLWLDTQLTLPLDNPAPGLSAPGGP